jgi:hypothetical protein
MLNTTEEADCSHASLAVKRPDEGCEKKSSSPFHTLAKRPANTGNGGRKAMLNGPPKPRAMMWKSCRTEFPPSDPILSRAPQTLAG